MCSIIGASSPKGKTIKFSDMKILYLMGESRGGHACGFTDGKRIIKSAVNSYDYVNKIMREEKYPKEVGTFIGHTRYATIGNKNKDDNAHPFAKKDIIGVHNGSIYNYEDLSTLMQSEAKVDSEILYEVLAKYGLKKTLPLLQGILALSWYNVHNKSIYLYRHNKPLWMGEKEGSLFWASIKPYLEAIDCTNLKQIQEHTVYKVKNGRIVEAKNIKKDLEPTPPATKKYGDTKRIDKKPTLKIFKDRKEHLESFNEERINRLVEEYNIEKEEPEEIEENIKVKNNQEYSVLEMSELAKVPSIARHFETTKDGEIFVWFSDRRDYCLKIFNVDIQMIESFDLTLDEDLDTIRRRYTHETCDLVQWIMHEYAISKEAMKRKTELLNGKTKEKSSK